MPLLFRAGIAQNENYENFKFQKIKKPEILINKSSKLLKKNICEVFIE